jgi:hypothetical protein
MGPLQGPDSRGKQTGSFASEALARSRLREQGAYGTGIGGVYALGLALTQAPISAVAFASGLAVLKAPSSIARGKRRFAARPLVANAARPAL